MPLAGECETLTPLGRTSNRAPCVPRSLTAAKEYGLSAQRVSFWRFCCDGTLSLHSEYTCYWLRRLESGWGHGIFSASGRHCACGRARHRLGRQVGTWWEERHVEGFRIYMDGLCAWLRAFVVVGRAAPSGHVAGGLENFQVLSYPYFVTCNGLV